ncbi:hypothetical protein PC129_g6868 [Phytophthora cactorum]|uniref:Uncharacterized protein n=1 Tax=Phytophthora cactorum TaxID=29920 RepID=A0A329RXX6_9STRA|nr:hypothetical protein Pcac1_g606 [Phytophthora cactorum]KAG2817997.1 hypothetical protein PC112_g12814 [Phytophthora cactorum]KAG2831791.1 hypothetical protein PC111_g6870 [Phytophthora cactorum]KAG2855927.1 hypothetical protein PC113_g12023 [Phytophthora cactorum]KAG2912689.1 hypothetical protein PC115_g12261 [Phytophthora cactorum]
MRPLDTVASRKCNMNQYQVLRHLDMVARHKHHKNQYEVLLL